MNRWSIGITLAIGAGVVSCLLLPSDWVMPAFWGGVVAAFISAVAARSDTKPRQPVAPLAEIALSVVNLPPDPFAEVPNGWPLWALAVSVAYLFSLFITIVCLANA